MNISPIQNFQSNSSFRAKKPNCYINKKMVYQPKRGMYVKPQKLISNAEEMILAGGSAILGIETLLKEHGITYCEPKDNTINIGGRNGDFYQIKTSVNFNTQQAKEYVLRSLVGSFEYTGGISNYQDMIRDIGRQDIIKKGLKIHTYVLNTNLSYDVRSNAARFLTRYTKLPVTVNDLFFIDEEAFYYDKLSKTAYSVSLEMSQKTDNAKKPSFRTCNFKTDSKGKAIGYDVKDWNWYNRDYALTSFSEQQEPSVKLPPIMNLDNNKEIAEAYRFGNASADSKLQIGIPKVLNHLHEKAKFDDVCEKDLQLVKYYNEGGHIERKIAYYNPSTGRSLVYNQEGKFLYQLDYNKDDFGNIISCTKF